MIVVSFFGSGLPVIVRYSLLLKKLRSQVWRATSGQYRFAIMLAAIWSTKLVFQKNVKIRITYPEGTMTKVTTVANECMTAGAKVLGYIQ